MTGKETEKLLRKMDEEYQDFRRRIETLPANLALEHAFEDVTKRDILLAIEEDGLDGKQAQALLKLPKPLETCYQYCLKEETDYMEVLSNSLQKTADREIKHQKQERMERKSGEACR